MGCAMLDEEKATAILGKFIETLQVLGVSVVKQCEIANMTLRQATALHTTGLLECAIVMEFLSSNPERDFADHFDEEDFIKKVRHHIELVRKEMVKAEVARKKRAEQTGTDGIISLQ